MPLIHWGIPFTEEQAIQYAKRYQIPFEDEEDKLHLPFIVVRHLAERLECCLEYALPLSIQYSHMVVLYSNKTLELMKLLSVEYEEEALTVIADEFGWEKDQGYWYWDGPSCGPQYVFSCPICNICH